MLTSAKRFIPPMSRDGLQLLQFFFLSKGKNQKPKYHHYDSVIKDDMLQLDCPSILFSVHFIHLDKLSNGHVEQKGY